MKELKLLVAGGAIALAFTGCSSVGGSPSAPPSSQPVASSVLQFAVGSANLPNGTTGLNVVATYRQPNGAAKPGDSAVAVNSPTITLPSNIAVSVGSPAGYDGCSTVLTGPASAEIGTASMTSTTQSPGAPCSTTQSTFGQSGGVFGLGIEPFNATGQADFTPPSANTTGTPFQVAPYPVPLYATATSNTLIPWGGPPAFLVGGVPDSLAGNHELVPAGTNGVSEGIDVFNGVAPVAGGAYSLSVSVPANTGTVTQKATFTLPPAITLLGGATAPAYAPDGNGGGTFAFTMPAGATEAYLEITDYGPPTGASCDGWASMATPVYYTIEATASGTLTLSDDLGPTAPLSAAANTVPSICTAAQNTTANGAATPGDQAVMQVVGFDYDAFGISYPNSVGKPSPSFANSNGSTDLTLSAAICQFDAGGGTQTACSPPVPALRRTALQRTHIK